MNDCNFSYLSYLVESGVRYFSSRHSLPYQMKIILCMCEWNIGSYPLLIFLHRYSVWHDLQVVFVFCQFISDYYFLLSGRLFYLSRSLCYVFVGTSIFNIKIFFTLYALFPCPLLCMLLTNKLFICL